MMTTWTLTTTIPATGTETSREDTAADRATALAQLTEAARRAVAEADDDALPMYRLTLDDVPIAILAAGRDEHGHIDRQRLLASIDELANRPIPETTGHIETVRH